MVLDVVKLRRGSIGYKRLRGYRAVSFNPHSYGQNILDESFLDKLVRGLKW